MVNIFKYVNSPMNLTLTCRNRFVIVKDSNAKTELLMVRYGKAHALFHARNVLIHFGEYDQKSIEFKIDHNVGQLNADRIQKIKPPWARNLFTYLLVGGCKQLSNDNND